MENMKDKQKLKNCKICNKEFLACPPQKAYCCDDCANKGTTEIKKAYIDKGRKKYDGIEGEDYVICKICGNKSRRIYGKHLKEYHNGMTSQEYKDLFPGALLSCKKDTQNISKNSGKHMKQEKYRKWASEKMKGRKNINSKNNTTEKQRKERSPFSKDFYESKDLSEKDRKDFIEEALRDREFEMRIEYWTKRGYTKNEAKEKVKKRQTTFSLEKCIEKYGEEKGLERWNKRQEKWMQNYPRSNYSKVSQVLFKQLHERIKGDFNEIYFATNGEKQNNEFILKLKEMTIKPDFLVKDNNKIIEFDGVYWHRNDIVNKNRESKRDEAIKRNNYSVWHVKENDFYGNPNKVIKECLEFIYEKRS